MTNEELQVLEIEASKGDRYQAAYNEMVVPFFEEKQMQFIAAFQDISVGDSERLASLHSQSKALDALRAEFQYYIDTGKIAKVQLQRV